MKQRVKRHERGNSIIEFSLMAPWLIFLFVGAMDWGFYAYALIATESAARVSCLYTSTNTADASDNTTACTYALGQLKKMPNVGTSCATSLAALSTTIGTVGATALISLQTSRPDTLGRRRSSTTAAGAADWKLSSADLPSDCVSTA